MANYDATSGSYTTRLTVTETGTDTATNTSTVNFSLTLIKNSGYGLWNNNSCSWSININGTSYSGSFTYDFRNYSSLTLKGSTNQTVTHNGDGTKSISVSASVNMDNTPYVYTMSPSGTLTLTTIPRASDVTVSNYSITNTTGSLSATITSKANFYHKWRWRMNSGTWSSWTNKGLISTTSSTVTVANTTLLAQLPTATSGSFNIEVATYSDSGYANHVGTKSATCTVSVNTSNIKPSVSLGNIGLNSSPISGYAVAGYSKVQSGWSTTNSSGATSVTTYFTVSTGSLATTSSTSTNGTVVSNVIPSNSSNYTLYIYAYAKDSRGAVSDTVNRSITVYGYQPPTANLTAYRTSSSSSTSEDGAGTYAYVTFSGAVRSSVNSQNTIQSTSCTYSGSISGTATNGGHYALADTQTVTFKLTVTDKVTSSTASVTMATAQYPLDLYDDGNGNVGVGLGAVAVANQVKTPLPINGVYYFSNVYTTAIDADELQTSGFYGIKFSPTTDLHYPVTDWGVLFVGGYSVTGTLFQIYIPDSTNTTIYKRAFDGSAWSAWQKLSVGTADSATTATNANNANYATSSGVTNMFNTVRTNVDLNNMNAYAGGTAVNRSTIYEPTNSASNIPKGNFGFVLTLRGADINYGAQLWLGENGIGMYYRPYINQNWGGWGKVDLCYTLWTGSLTGGNGLDLAMSAYKRIRIYASMVGGALLYNWEVDLERINRKDCSHSEPKYFANDGWYDVCAIVSASTSLVYFARAVNINKATGASAEHNNTTDYQIYRIDGII